MVLPLGWPFAGGCPAGVAASVPLACLGAGASPPCVGFEEPAAGLLSDTACAEDANAVLSSCADDAIGTVVSFPVSPGAAALTEQAVKTSASIPAQNAGFFIVMPSI